MQAFKRSFQNHLCTKKKFEQNVYVQEKNVKKDLIEEKHESFKFVLTFFICFDLNMHFEIYIPNLQIMLYNMKKIFQNNKKKYH